MVCVCGVKTAVSKALRAKASEKKQERRGAPSGDADKRAQQEHDDKAAGTAQGSEGCDAQEGKEEAQHVTAPHVDGEESACVGAKCGAKSGVGKAMKGDEEAADGAAGARRAGRASTAGSVEAEDDGSGGSGRGDGGNEEVRGVKGKGGEARGEGVARMEEGAEVGSEAEEATDEETGKGESSDEAKEDPEDGEEKIGVRVDYFCCKRCCERAIDTVLVPCGHKAYCKRCARALRECPICKAKIARVQTVFHV